MIAEATAAGERTLRERLSGDHSRRPFAILGTRCVERFGLSGCRRTRRRWNFQVYTPICTLISAVISGTHPGETRMYAGVHLARYPQVPPWSVAVAVAVPGGSLSAVVDNVKPTV